MKFTFSFVFLFLFVSIFVVVFGGAAFQVHPLLGLAVAAFFYYAFFYSHLKLHKNWNSLPTLDQYLASHGNCKSNKGISCFQCNSSSIKNWGVNNANDHRRIHICNHCNAKLYKSQNVS